MPMSRKQKRKPKAERNVMEKTNVLNDLPSDLQLEILTRLDHNDRLTLSLVSKYFQTLADPFVHKLKFDRRPSCFTFRKLFYRFASVNSIVIKFQRDLGRALIEISSYHFKIESLEILVATERVKQRHMDILSGRFRMVKVLKLSSCVYSVFSNDCFSLFPSLEELDCSESFDWCDEAIAKMVINAPKLRKIILDGNFFVTDKSLYVLANCVYLEDISLKRCNWITANGLITFVLEICEENMVQVIKTT